MPVPRNHKREENAAIKAGETPEGLADKPAKQCQKSNRTKSTAPGSRTSLARVRVRVTHIFGAQGQ